MLEQNPPSDDDKIRSIILNFSPFTTDFLTEFNKIINNFQLS